MGLTKDAFLAGSDFARKDVEIEGLGTVVMRELTMGEQLRCTKLYVGEEARDISVGMAMIAMSLRDGDAPMFDHDKIEDAVAVLLEQKISTVALLQDALGELSGVSEEDVEAAAGNSTEIPTGSSSTDSPGISDTLQPEPSQES